MADTPPTAAGGAPPAPVRPASPPRNPPLSALVLAQRDVQGRILGDLRFMLHHFVQLQSARELEPAPQTNGETPENRERLASFIKHLEQQIEKCLKPAKKEAELEALERHVTKTLLPVKARLEHQLDQATSTQAREAARRIQEQRAVEALALGRAPSPVDTSPPPVRTAPAAGPDRVRAPLRVRIKRPAARPRDPPPALLKLEDAEGDIVGCLGALGGATIEPPAKRRKQVSTSVVTDSSSGSCGKSSSSEGDVRASPQRSKNRVSNRGSRALLGEPARDLRFDHFDVRTVQVLPEAVEYTCSVCAHAYTAACHLNPWWSLAKHACPRCEQTQFPRIDISSAANRIGHPPPAALDRAHEAARAAAAARPPPALPPGAAPRPAPKQSEDGPLLAGDAGSETLAARLCSAAQGAQLLDLFAHARRCPGHHRDPQHAAVCANAKFVMLHARDCTAATCPYTWCGAVRKLLRHVVRCPHGATCPVCATESGRSDAPDLARPATDYWQALRQAGGDDEAKQIVG